MIYESAEQCWTRLDSIKQPLMTRIERYASLTIPKICLPDGFDVESTGQTHDYQSLGAQCVNHLTNKIMLAAFAPTRPFFRAELSKEALAQVISAQPNVTAVDIGPILSQIERDAVKELDIRGQRPKLYQALRHVIVAGNVLVELGKEAMRVMGLRYFCVKRDGKGRLHTLIIRERIKYDELDEKVKDNLAGRYHDTTEVNHYKIIRRVGKMFEMTQWVDHQQLPKEFNGRWSEDKVPYIVLTWDLADESDYATGLIEEYEGDLEALSVLSESIVDGAVLGCEYRWLVNPTGMTSADDLNNSKNGDALPGKPEDIAPTQGGNPTAIDTADKVRQGYERRIAMAFLLQSAVTRDAERVTAEEIRATAQELETAYGGVYSALSNGLQRPVALWLLEVADLSISGTEITISIVTGLDALSRNGDLENLRLALGDLAQIATLPPELQGRIKFEAIAKYVGDGRGVDLTPFLKSEKEYAAYLQQMQQARVNEAAATSAGQAQGEASAQPTGT